MDESQVNDRAEALRRRRRELYRIRMDRETPEEAELRRARRRERDRRTRQAQTAEQAELRRATRRQNDRHRRDHLSAEQSLQQRRVVYNTNSQRDQSSSGTQVNRGTSGCATNTVQVDGAPRFNQPSVIAKMTEFHVHMDSLQPTKCEVCQERFPNLRVDDQQICKRCSSDKHEPKLFSTQNNMNPGTLPPELTVSFTFYICTSYISYFIFRV